MNAMRLRGLIALCLAAATLALANAFVPTIKIADLRPKVPLSVSFPVAFGDWTEDRSMPVVLPSPDQQATLNTIYNQILARTYVNREGYRIMLSVAYGGDLSDGMSVHRPEACYPAQGFELKKLWSDQLRLSDRSIFVTRATTQLGGRKEPLTYWIINGDEVIKRGFDGRIVQLKYTLRGKIPDGMLVRVSSIDPDPTHAFEMQDRFSRDMVQALDAPFRARIIGLMPA